MPWIDYLSSKLSFGSIISCIDEILILLFVLVDLPPPQKFLMTLHPFKVYVFALRTILLFMAIGFEVQFPFTFRLFIFCYFFAIKITLSIVFHPILHVDFFNLFNLVLDYFYLILNESFFTENLLTFLLNVFLGFQHSCFEDLSLGGEEF